MPKRIAIDYRINKRGCHVCTSHAGNSYGYPDIRRDGKRTTIPRHIFEQSYGPIPTGLCICHMCDNPGCIRAEHLFLGTKADNNEDMRRKGRDRNVRGSAQGKAKLTEDQVLMIFASSKSQRVLGREYGISHTQIGYIKHGKNWGWLTSPGD